MVSEDERTVQAKRVRRKDSRSLFTTRQLFFTHPHQYAKRLLLVHHQTIICY
jgi:hypothetical protein